MSRLHDRIADMVSLMQKAPRYQNEISKLTGLSHDTVSALLDSFAGEGLIAGVPTKLRGSQIVMLWTWQP